MNSSPSPRVLLCNTILNPAIAMPDIASALDAADRGLDASLERLYAFLRIPSISTDPAYAGECRRAAEWAAASLREIGFDAAARETLGLPLVVGHRRCGRPGAPRVLFYGHYDVQPPDPLELWDSPPFEPQRVAGPHGEMIIARGASDDKGQVMTFFEACRALMATVGELPVDVTILVEGEEESVGVGLIPFLKANKEEVASDFAQREEEGSAEHRVTVYRNFS